MKWNQLFSHNTRRQEGTADSLLRLLAPSLLGMAVCVLTLCSLTWAWFNMSVGSSITGIQSSEVEVCLVTKTTEGENVKWAVGEPLVANGEAKETTLDSDKNIYFIARGTAANAYLQIGDKYYGPLDLTKGPDASGNYPVYSITLSDASSVSVSLRWGTVESDSISKDTTIVSVGIMLWPDGSNSFSLILPDNEDEEPNTTPVIDPSADDPQPQPETPANGDTGDNTSDANNDDAQTPDGSTTGDAKDPDATGGNTSDTGDTGTSGDGNTSGSTDTGSDPDSSTTKEDSAEKNDGDTNTSLDGSVVKAAAD